MEYAERTGTSARKPDRCSVVLLDYSPMNPLLSMGNAAGARAPMLDISEFFSDDEELWAIFLVKPPRL